MGEMRLGSGMEVRLGRVEGDLRVSQGAVIRGEDETGAHVTGRVCFEGNCEVECDLECGSLEGKSGMVRLGGNLKVHGEAEVENSIYVRKDLNAEEVDVGGRISIGGAAICKDANVGGVMEVEGALEADSVEVGGRIRVLGIIKVNDLEVGGEAEVGEGRIEGSVEVGGRFSSGSNLHFGALEVVGLAELGPENVGMSLEVGGRLTTRGNLQCDVIEVGGDLKAEGNLKGGRIEVGGRATASGTLEFSSRFEVGGSVEVGGEMRGRDLEVGGNFGASRVILTGAAEMGGVTETRGGFKAREIELPRGAVCKGSLIAERVEVGRGCKTDDIHAREILVGRGASVGRLFGDRIKIDEKCSVQGVQYTRELDAGERTTYASPPEMVTKLPDPPL